MGGFYLVEMSPEDTPHLSIEAEVVGQGTLDIVQQSSACSIPSKQVYVYCIMHVTIFFLLVEKTIFEV